MTVCRAITDRCFLFVWDANKGTYFKAGMVYFPIKHPEFEEQLYLVICRPGKGRKPWYLITNRPVESKKDAWRIILAYAKRWQIESAFRFNKSELAIQSPRNKKYEYRKKMMAMVTLVYSFLLKLVLNKELDELRKWLLRNWCHRTGYKNKLAKLPLYRLRWALAELWNTYKIIKNYPEFVLLQNSG